MGVMLATVAYSLSIISLQPCGQLIDQRMLMKEMAMNLIDWIITGIVIGCIIGAVMRLFKSRKKP
jgi:hypothetical protein